MPHIVVDVMSGVSTLLGISLNKILVIDQVENKPVENKYELAIGIIFITFRIYF